MFPSYLGLELSGLALLDGGVQAHRHHLDRARQVFPANLGKKRVSGLQFWDELYKDHVIGW